MQTVEHTAAQRRSLADLVDQLDQQQWTTQSLCDAWEVRHVVGHLNMIWGVPPPKFVWSMIRHRGYDNANLHLSRELGEWPREQLTAGLRDNADNSKTPPGFPPEAALMDLLVHTRDITVPLGLTHDAPDEAARIVLDFAVSKHGRRYQPGGGIEGLTFTAPDIGWSHGTGPEVSGKALDLAAALQGRPTLVERLTGPGVPTLAGRFG